MGKIDNWLDNLLGTGDLAQAIGGIGPGLLGNPGGDLNTAAAVQQGLAQQAQNQAWQLMSAQPQRVPSQPFESNYFTERKATQAIDALARELSFNVLRKIHEIRYLHETGGFHLRFASGHEMHFEDADRFPTDADIARICLEAP